MKKKSAKLRVYQEKRKLKRSKEPAPKVIKKKGKDLAFVIQKHAARHLHYDFRLEAEGVLKSWAVPKGPSLDPHTKRLAIQVEDHPYAYKDFEGVIPEGYGAGTVEIWDEGIYTVDGNSGKEAENLILQGLKKGEIHFFLEGKRLRGEFVLVKLKQKENQWLLIKRKDPFVSKEDPTQASSLKKVSHSKMPHHVKPMLATLIDHPFDSPEWLFELKMDGFRALAELKGAQVELYSRNLKSFNTRFKTLVEELKKLKLNAILDGEVVALDETGMPRFQLLQNQLKEPGITLCYAVFDLLYLEGKDLRAMPLIERKALLKGVFKRRSSLIYYLDHVEGKGKQFLEQVKKTGGEGIIGKKKESPYKEGTRSTNWVKIKAYQRQEALICGFTAPRRGRKHFGALILGVYKRRKLHYIGLVGGGFTEKSLKEIKELLSSAIQQACPFEKRPPVGPTATWVKPKQVCEVRFSEWTQEKLMRQPIFLGLRTDKAPTAVKEEQPIQTRTVVKKSESESYDFFTNLKKIYWPKEKITKEAFLGFYAAMAPVILPYLIDRPQSLKRFPNGIEGDSFFQKNVEKSPDWVSTIPIEHENKTIRYLLIQDEKSLLYAANLGCIELHPWLSRYQHLDFPDFLVFDLDPEEIAFDKVIETANSIHDVLGAIDVPSFCKTTGATGLHVYVPLQARYTYEQAKQFAVLVATYVHQLLPAITSLERQPKKRKERVYIDCFQNNRGQTVIAPYSLRARPGAPVALPLPWSEVKKGVDPQDFTFFNVFDWIKKKEDPFKPILGEGIDMEKALQKFEKLTKRRLQNFPPVSRKR